MDKENKMLTISKYRTIGNDFIIVDNRDGSFDEFRDDTDFKKRMNNRIFGIGSTGIVEIKSHHKYPFEMFYHVGTGEQGLACGTGSRCLVAYARDFGFVEDEKTFHFQSYEGVRTASITGNQVTLSMTNDSRILFHDENDYFIDVKCYIHVKFITEGIDEYNIVQEGKKITMADKYKSYFPIPTFMLVQICANGQVKVRCYDPTTNPEVELFACGTGSTGAGIAYAKKLGLIGRHSVPLQWRDGITKITLTRDADDHFTDVKKSGEAMHLYNATIDTEKFRKTYVNQKTLGA